MVTSTTEAPSKTLETLRSLVLESPALTDEHLKRLAQILGRDDYRNSFAARMAVRGFNWSVTREGLLAAFRYAAALSGGSETELVSRVTHRGLGRFVGKGQEVATAAIVFGGYIPPFALDAIERAKKAGAIHFTVHSNEPLKTTEIPVPVEDDPVVIGWNDYPFICTEDGNRFRIRQSDKSGSKLVGVFVTGWDLDKEFQLPVPA